jgi:hypothetical protein
MGDESIRPEDQLHKKIVRNGADHHEVMTITHGSGAYRFDGRFANLANNGPGLGSSPEPIQDRGQLLSTKLNGSRIGDPALLVVGKHWGIQHMYRAVTAPRLM